MEHALFRKEAMEHQRHRGLGDVILATAPGSRQLALLTLLAAALTIAFVCYGEFTRKAHVSGYLVPDKGLIKVYAPAAGTVIERRVDEGQQVKRGDPLAVVSTERSSLDTVQTQAAAIGLVKQRRDSLRRERLAREEIDRLKLQRLDRRIASLEHEIGKLDDSRKTQRQRLLAAEQTAARFAKLRTDKFVADAQVQQTMDIALDQRGRLQDLERDHIALEGEREALRFERDSALLEAQTHLAALTREIAELDQELTVYESNRDMVVTAPTDGIVTAILIEPGQHTQPDAPLLNIIPDGAILEAQLLVPSHAIGFVEQQQQVALRYEAYPYQRFGHHRGRVRSIAKTLISPSDAALPIPLQEPVYLVSVTLDAQTVLAYGRELPLKVGMLLDGDIFLDRRTVLEWILDPLFSLTKRI